MQSILKIFPWRRTVFMTIGILVLLIGFNFYSLYTNKFYFFKLSNYVFPILSLVHFIYLYVIWFKITEDELPDPKMRNLEYVLYGVMIIYVFKTVQTFSILLSYGNYDDHVIPVTFVPIGIFILILYVTLLVLALVLVKHRKDKIGNYDFTNFNNNMNSWQ